VLPLQTEDVHSQGKPHISTSTPEKDTDIGIRNIKIDNSSMKLTEDQKLVREYFDKDYLTIQFYDDLLRYPDAYENTQIYVVGTIERMISYKDDNYELLLRTDDYTNDTENDLIYVCGEQAGVRAIQGDMIALYGRYHGVETVQVDGNSYVIPSVKAFRTMFAEDAYTLPQKFDHAEIKQIASLIFGNEIEVRFPNDENEAGYGMFLAGGWDLSDSYIVELENKTNAKFEKFRFYTQCGYIEPVGDKNSSIVRTIEFMPDFQHFLIISHDWKLSTGEITCYDTTLQRVWSREFENVKILGHQIPYDFTANNVYVATNNRIYIINAKTGEDTFEPVYVGQKTEIRKIENGILAFSAENVDPVMFMDLNGSVLWTTNIENCVGLGNAGSIQLIDDKIVAQVSFIRDMDHILVLDRSTGKLILDCTPSVYY